MFSFIILDKYQDLFRPVWIFRLSSIDMHSVGGCVCELTELHISMLFEFGWRMQCLFMSFFSPLRLRLHKNMNRNRRTYRLWRAKRSILVRRRRGSRNSGTQHEIWYRWGWNVKRKYSSDELLLNSDRIGSYFTCFMWMVNGLYGDMCGGFIFSARCAQVCTNGRTHTHIHNMHHVRSQPQNVN